MPLPAGWVDIDRSGPASDLTLAVLLVNTIDLLEHPADRLETLDWFSRALHTIGHPALADSLSSQDLGRLRALRVDVRRGFEAPSADLAMAALNPWLARDAARVQLVAGERVESVELAMAPDASGVEALEARLPWGLARFIAEHGVGRLGVCGSDPCRCVFIDRTRGGTRRYCCTYCNDRAAARAYRRRQREG